MPKRIYPPELHTFVAEHASGTNDRDLTELINARFGNGYMTEAQGIPEEPLSSERLAEGARDLLLEDISGADCAIHHGQPCRHRSD